MRHRNAVKSQIPCTWVQYGNATQLRLSLNGPLNVMSCVDPLRATNKKKMKKK